MSVTLAISILFSFHAILDWPENYMEQANQGGELVGFWVAGLVAGRLFERERSLLKNLVRAHEETLLGLVSALDMKEHNTHLHSQRVKQNMLLLADRIGLGEARKRAIGFGALLWAFGGYTPFFKLILANSFPSCPGPAYPAIDPPSM